MKEVQEKRRGGRAIRLGLIRSVDVVIRNQQQVFHHSGLGMSWSSTDLWVPPPLTLGILATARPVPHDSAEVWGEHG